MNGAWDVHGLNSDIQPPRGGHDRYPSRRLTLQARSQYLPASLPALTLTRSSASCLHLNLLLTPVLW